MGVNRIVTISDTMKILVSVDKVCLQVVADVKSDVHYGLHLHYHLNFLLLKNCYRLQHQVGRKDEPRKIKIDVVPYIAEMISGPENIYWIFNCDRKQHFLKILLYIQIIVWELYTKKISKILKTSDRIINTEKDFHLQELRKCV